MVRIFKKIFNRKKELSYEKSKTLFGTTCFIKAFGSNSKKAVLEAFEILKDLNEKFSVFNKNSEVSNFNNTKGEPFKCSKDMMELLVKAKNYSKLTEGAF
ncbi:MAG: FAD:protein FMN transferase, partial [Sarcina sp.]